MENIDSLQYSSLDTTRIVKIHWATNLHSEYRSTYKWHEFKSNQQGAVTQSQPAPNPSAGYPSRGSDGLFSGPMEPAMPRRKKYPGVAYKSNELFDAAPTNDIRPQITSAFDRARSIQRNEVDRAGRRSKSEGPRQTRWTDTVEPKTTTAVGETLTSKDRVKVSTEYRNQYAWPKDTTDAPRKSISMGALKKAAAAEGAVEAEPLIGHAEDHIDGPSSYNDDYVCQKRSFQRKSTFRSALSAFISNGEDRSKDNRKRYKSEYKKKFRPFSQYVFEASKGTFTKCRGKKSSGDGEASERMLGGEKPAEGTVGEETSATLRAAGLQPLILGQSDSWYREVLDLRKRAGEYKYRGWGTELAPDHITQLYNKQIELWHQVSRRSSLSALALATTNHKVLARDEKDGKDSKNQSPKKFRSFRTAPLQSIHAKIQETKSSPHKTSPQKQKKKMGQSFDEAHTQDGTKSETKGEFRSPRRRPRSADPAPVANKHIPNGHEPHPRPTKPTGLPLKSTCTNRVRSSSTRGGRSPSAPSKPGAIGPVVGANGPERRSRSVSKVGIKLDPDAPCHRSASVAKDHFFDDSPVVKSPPEPTRVKSPEQMNMRSPDPVNWTVPLDTGKTFTVTQNVKSEIAPVHHQQMSPIRSLKNKSESPTNSKRTDKTPTTPNNLTPIDETKALDLGMLNGTTGVIGTNGVIGTTGVIGTNGVIGTEKLNGTIVINGSDITPDKPQDISKFDPEESSKMEKEVVKKTIEATQVAPGVVDTTVVTEGSSSMDVLDKARNRIDKFFGKEEDKV